MIALGGGVGQGKSNVPLLLSFVLPA